MFVSIAMTTYNGEKYLREQLDSFNSQTRPPDELVVCDDGSTDDTLRILQAFREVAGFAVRIVCNERNLGFTKNFCKTMKLCDGDVVFLSDQDDVWFPEKISTILGAFEANPSASLVVHDGKLVTSGLEWLGVTKLGQVLSGFGDSDSLVMGALTAYKRELAQLALPVPDGVVGHDQWIHLIARLAGRRIVIPDVLQLIRRHESNTSGWIASSPVPISPFDVFKSQWRSSVAASYSDRLLINHSAMLLFERVAGGLDSTDAWPQISSALKFLQRERKALIAREGLGARGWFGRKIQAIRMLFAGDYRHFNRYKSFLRDIAR